jgi:hypothetical protein
MFQIILSLILFIVGFLILLLSFTSIIDDTIYRPGYYTALEWAEKAKIYGNNAKSAVAVTLGFYYTKKLIFRIEKGSKIYWKVPKKEKQEFIKKIRYIALKLQSEGMNIKVAEI